jgi:hypothetical protein
MSAWRTVRRCTWCRSANSRMLSPSSRCWRRILSNSSTLDNSFSLAPTVWQPRSVGAGARGGAISGHHSGLYWGQIRLSFPAVQRPGLLLAFQWPLAQDPTHLSFGVWLANLMELLDEVGCTLPATVGTDGVARA